MEAKVKKLEEMRAKLGLKFDVPKTVKEKDNEDNSDAEVSNDDEPKTEDQLEKRRKKEEERVKKMASKKYQEKNPGQIIADVNTVQENESLHHDQSDDEYEDNNNHDMLDYISLDRCTNPVSNIMDKGTGLKKLEVKKEEAYIPYNEGGEDDFEKALTNALEKEPGFAFSDEENDEK